MGQFSAGKVGQFSERINTFLNNLSLDPKESYFIDFLYINNDGNRDDVRAMITIFYGQPEETEYYFIIRFKK